LHQGRRHQLCTDWRLLSHLLLQATKPVLTQGRQVLGHDGEVLLEDSHEQQYVSREALYM
jgi:hypothetical protein